MNDPAPSESHVEQADRLMTSKAARRCRAGISVGCALLGLAAFGLGGIAPAGAQAIDLSHGGPVTVTSDGGIEWRQKSQEVIADQNAKAVRGDVTVTANQLIAHYRKKAGTGSAAPATAQGQTQDQDKSGGADQSGGLDGNNQIYLLEALGNVHIFTPTDQAWGDHGAYDMDQGVLVLTGHNLKLTTPRYVVTARDSLEYWSNQHMAVARGDAVLVTDTGRRIAADVLVAYTDAGPAPAAGPTPVTQKTTPGGDAADDASGKLKRVDAIGHVVIMTATEIVQGDRAVYDPGLSIARIAGHVRITRGQNVLAGDEALVNMKTGIARLLSQGDAQVKGLIIPNQADPGAAPVAKPAAH